MDRGGWGAGGELRGGGVVGPVIVCPYAARTGEGKAMCLDAVLCHSCGLCVTGCPTAALIATK